MVAGVRAQRCVRLLGTEQDISWRTGSLVGKKNSCLSEWRWWCGARVRVWASHAVTVAEGTRCGCINSKAMIIPTRYSISWNYTFSFLFCSATCSGFILFSFSRVRWKHRSLVWLSVLSNKTIKAKNFPLWMVLATSHKFWYAELRYSSVQIISNFPPHVCLAQWLFRNVLFNWQVYKVVLVPLIFIDF